MSRTASHWDDACDDAVADMVFGREPLRQSTLRIAFSGRAARRAGSIFLSGTRRVSLTQDLNGEGGHAYS